MNLLHDLPARILHLMNRDVTVICGPEAITLNFSRPSALGRQVVRAEIPYDLAAGEQRAKLSMFRFHVARARFVASRS